MSFARRILIVGGIALALWGMAYGLWYAVFAEHQALDGIGASLSRAFAGAAERNPERAQAALAQYRETKYVYDRQVDVHSHWIGLGMILIVLGIGLNHVTFRERARLALSLSAFLGAVIFPFGVLLQTVNHGAFPRVIAVIGLLPLLISLAGFTIGFARMGFRPNEGEA